MKTKTTRERKREEEPAERWLGLMLALLRGGVVALAAALLVLMGGAALISAGTISDGAADRIAVAACVAGAFVGGLLSVPRGGRSGALLAGLGVGAILFLLLLTAGMLLYGDASLERGGAAEVCACLCGGALAGLLRGSAKKKRRR